MTGTDLQTAYDTAAAVFSRRFRFVEWKYVIPGADGNSFGLGDAEEPQHRATKEIDRRKWIYVFRQNVGSQSQHTPIQAEIRIDATGEMAATPHNLIESDLKARAHPVPIGKSLSVPRRVRGQPMVYRFYASRVQMPREQIKALEASVYKFAPPTLLDPGNNTSVVEKDGEWRVPVVDPITVALHFQAAFSAAADDLINYTAAHVGLDPRARGRVARRRKKHLLATLLKAIIGEKGRSAAADNLVHELKNAQYPLEEFVTHYGRQVQWRVERRDRFGSYLVRWLASDAMKIAAAAHRARSSAAFGQFLVHWCDAIARLAETPAGREYVAGLLDDKSHFIHTYVWPANELSDDAFQTVRKGSMAVLTAWKELAEMRILVKGGDYVGYVTDVVATFRRLRRFKQSQPLTPTIIKQMIDIDGKIRATFLIDPDEFKDVHYRAVNIRRLMAIVESVNLVLSFKSTMDKMQGADPRAKELAIIGLVGSTLDASSAVASLFKKTAKIAATLGFVSGVIDIYLGVERMDKAFKEGDQPTANGQFLAAAGATIGTAGTAMALLAMPPPAGQIVGIIGLFIVAAGLFLSWSQGKQPLARFFDHCSWGKHHLQAGGADWSPTRFEQWTGDKEFDYQLEALLNIICKIELSHVDSYRNLRVKVGWLPPNAKLVVRYEEAWRQAAARTVEATIVMSDAGPKSSNPRLTAVSDGKNGVALVADPGFPSKVTTIPAAGVRIPHPELERAKVTAKLLLSFDGTGSVTVPHTGAETKTFIKR